jgi:hypothetical protein
MKNREKKKLINSKKTVIPDRMPYLVRIGSIKKSKDVGDQLNQVLITPDHLLVLCEVLLDHMWVEHKHGTPIEERASLLKDLHYDIHMLFEIALAAQFLRER